MLSGKFFMHVYFFTHTIQEEIPNVLAAILHTMNRTVGGKEGSVTVRVSFGGGGGGGGGGAFAPLWLWPAPTWIC